MVEHQILTDHKIQDYIDGRLNARDRAAVAAYLLVHPDVASQVEMLATKCRLTLSLNV